MRLKFAFLLFFPICLFSMIGCVSLENSYNDQPALRVQHDAEMDAAKYLTSKIFLLIPETGSGKIKREQIIREIEKSMEAENIFKLPLIGQKQHEKIAASKGLTAELNRITRGYYKGITDKEIENYGKKINADIILIPVIEFHDYDDTPVSSEYSPSSIIDDYYWPALNVMEMQIKSEISISLRIINTAQPHLSETVKITHQITENYDTMETFSGKLKSIQTENIQRSVENTRRKKEEEYKREERDRERDELAQNADSKFDNAFVAAITVMDIAKDMGGDDWVMLKPLDKNPVYKKAIYTDKKLLHKDLVSRGGNKMFKSFMMRFDGMTLSGDCINGSGIFMLLNGDICTGQWKDSMATGACEYRYADGSLFKGPFIGGIAEGDGTYIRKNGNVFTGTYKNGKKDGVGILKVIDPDNVCYYSNGSIVKGITPTFNYPRRLEPGSTYKVRCFDGSYISIIEKIQ